ncbi:EamA family transporter [Nocardia huaxiensis]|uniref:EamA family transporter n=1 Tax=Nocardia huaxiensis TaxID=2755382 RepID=UPI001E4DB252|nr:DMT family transporter [Nocardia huaxiensis]UFS97848.1 DMT family transporter [Nocardia huaxiensis]
MSITRLPVARVLAPRAALCLALLVALLFALVGPLIAALQAAGWSTGGIALARTGGAALVLLVASTIADRGRPRIRRHHILDVVAYGVGAVAVAQVGLILALQTLEIGVAVAIQFLACAVVVAWEWVRHRRRPAATTIGGLILAVGGTIMVVNPFHGDPIHWTGIGWAVASMLGVVVFFAAPATPNRPSALTLGAWGMVVGAVIVAGFVRAGVLPARFSNDPGEIAGHEISSLAIVVVLVVASSVAPHLLTMMVITRLGATSTSLILLTEVLFAGLLAWGLRGQPLTLLAAIGGLGICGGIAIAQIGDVRA